MTTYRKILLIAIPGLMFCIIPFTGMAFRFSWQIASIWLAGFAFTAFLSSWWLRIFFLLTLWRTATLMPDIEAYMALVVIAIFLAAAEGVRHIEVEKIMRSLRITAFLLLAWMILQMTGILPKFFPAHPASGPFNPDTASVVFALCLPAFYRGRWRYLLFVPLSGLFILQVTTGFAASAAATAVYIWMSCRNRRRIMAWGVALLIIAGVWFWQIDPLSGTLKDNRWLAWKHAAWSMRSEYAGRGLGSWATVFPLLASGEPKLGKVIVGENKITMRDFFMQAHNEYVQAAFELGLQVLLLLIAFVIAVGTVILRRKADAVAAAGITALLVCCLGFFTFHVAPSALIGCAWIGVWCSSRIGDCYGQG